MRWNCRPAILFLTGISAASSSSFTKPATRPGCSPKSPGLDYRNTGIAAATGGVVSAVVLRATDTCGDIHLRHNAELRFIFILNGQATFRDAEPVALAAGDSCAVPPDYDSVLEAVSADFECLEIMVPGKSGS